MTRVKIDKSHLLGQQDIDRDHLQMIAAINVISDAIEDGECELCKELFNTFIFVCGEHFRKEEAFLSEVGYPDLERHAGYHDELLEKAEAIRAKCADMSDKHEMARRFDELAVSLIDDVIKGDRELLPYLAEKRLVAV